MAKTPIQSPALLQAISNYRNVRNGNRSPPPVHFSGIDLQMPRFCKFLLINRKFKRGFRQLLKRPFETPAGLTCRFPRTSLEVR